MPQLNFNALASGGPQSVYEGFMQGQEIRNKLVQQEQARQLTDIQRQHATLQLQNATREQQAADEESAAWKAGAGDPKVVLQQLQQRGLGKSAMALQGQLTKQQSDKLAQQKATVDLVKHSANQVFANPGSALQILQSFGQRTGVDMSDDIAEVQRLGGDLEAVKRWAAGKAFEADKLLPKFQTIDQNDKKTVQGFDPVTGQPVGPGTVYSVGMSPAQVAQNKIAQGQLDVSRGQLKVAQDRLNKEGAQLDPIENQVLSQAIAEGRVDINKINGRNAKIYAGALQSQPGIDLREMSFENVASAAGARTLGTQSASQTAAASEVTKMLPLVKGYVAKTDPGNYPKVNAAGLYIASNTGDRNATGLAQSLNALVNTYARVISPKGVPTVSDKEHIRKVINDSMASGQFDEFLNVVLPTEMQAALESNVEASKVLKDQRAAAKVRGGNAPSPAATRPSLDSIFGRPK